jgi:hypothetical protein
MPARSLRLSAFLGARLSAKCSDIQAASSLAHISCYSSSGLRTTGPLTRRRVQSAVIHLWEAGGQDEILTTAGRAERRWNRKET